MQVASSSINTTPPPKLRELNELTSLDVMPYFKNEEEENDIMYIVLIVFSILIVIFLVLFGVLVVLAAKSPT
jgi:hypothetical protein